MNGCGIAQRCNARASRLNTALSVFAEVTRACNLRCYHCYQGTHAPGRQLSLAQWETLLGRLAAHGTLYCAFSGGEPFMRADFIDIVAAARRRDFAVSIISNGTLIDDAVAGRIAELGVMDVGVSLHAAHASLHDRLSGTAGSFSSALAAVRALVRKGVKVLVKHCVTSENFGEYRALGRLADEEGCCLEADDTVLAPQGARQSPYALSVAQHREFFEDMDLSPYTGDAVPDGWSLHCDAGRSMGAVNAAGDVLPCILLPVCFGNAARRPFEEIWHGESACAFRAQEQALDSECVDCAMQPACSRCNAVAYAETGWWRGKSPGLCDRARAMQARRVSCEAAAGNVSLV